MTQETGGRGPGRRLPLMEVAVVAVLAILGGVFLIPTFQRQRAGSYLVSCTSNLKQIYTFAMSYSDLTGSRFFPLAPDPSPRAHDSLNLMIAFDPEGLHPKLFTCPEGEASQVAPGRDGSFTLSAGTLDYAWIANHPRHLNLPLASDKYIEGFRDAAGTHLGHKGGMQVLMMDNRVEFVPASKLPPDSQIPAGLTR